MNDLKRKILGQLQVDLAQIEAALKDNLTPYLDLVSETARHILFSGGKRLRPLLMILAARLCGYRGVDDKMFSCVFEYLHAATLLHDDLVDDAELRRGKQAAHMKWGNETAVLVGDFLLARGLSIAAKTGSLKVIEIISEITENMSQGEIHQLQNKGNIDISENEYLEIIRRKTAILIQGACRVGAVIAGADEKKEAALSSYGYHVGLAFQMVDDLLDYLADTQTIGKKVGADLREGKLTLPVIVALNAAMPSDRRYMEKIIKNRAFSVEAFGKLIELLKKYGGIRYTQQLASENIEMACRSLEVFKEGETRDLLADIARYALARKV